MNYSNIKYCKSWLFYIVIIIINFLINISKKNFIYSYSKIYRNLSGFILIDSFADIFKYKSLPHECTVIKNKSYAQEIAHSLCNYFTFNFFYLSNFK